MELCKIVLDLFDGAGGGAGAATGAAASGTATASAPAQQGETGTPATPTRETTRRGRGKSGQTGELSNVLYGKQPEPKEGSAASTEPKTDGQQAQAPDAGAQEAKTPASAEERAAAFKAMVQGEYKDEYTKATQDMINRRFKDVKGMQSTLEAQAPILSALASRYGIQDGDVSKIMQAIENDDLYFEQRAEEHGMTTEQYKAWDAMQRQNEMLRKQQAHQMQMTQAERQMQEWAKQADEVKQVYPDFDFESLMQNDDAKRLMRSFVPLKAVYEVLNLDNIKQNTAQQQHQATEKAVTDNIRAKGNRPAENGASSQPGAVIKSDPTAMTKADRAEIRRRVQNGEKIYF